MLQQERVPGILDGKQEPPANHLPSRPWVWWLVLAFQCGRVLATEPGPANADFESQAKVVQLIQTVISDYWHGSVSNSISTTNSTTTYTNVESAFREASRLMPNRLDLRYGLASALMSQALQTNGTELRTRLNAALGEYQEIQSLDINSFDAPMLYVAYTRAVGETNKSDEILSRLSKRHPERTKKYVQSFVELDRILESAPNQTPSRAMRRDHHHAIVVLGAGLETNGAMKTKLADRLHQALRLARIYRRAPIIVTGGNQKGGVTEAYVMASWLMKHGVRKKRISLEDKARDTVENALFSSTILQRLGVTHVTVVTSANHFRRGLADLEEACRQRGLQLQYGTLSSKTKGDTDLDPIQERLGVYRDFMRTSGIWAYPGLQR